jgi:hypothetical protein
MGLFDLFSNDSAEKARDQRKRWAQQGYTRVVRQFGQGRDALTTNYGNASGLYNNLLTSMRRARRRMAMPAGANGAEGLARATTNFKNSGSTAPMASLNEGLQALQRTHAAAGNLNSGNADTDTLKFATDQAARPTIPMPGLAALSRCQFQRRCWRGRSGYRARWRLERLVSGAGRSRECQLHGAGCIERRGDNEQL